MDRSGSAKRGFPLLAFRFPAPPVLLLLVLLAGGTAAQPPSPQLLEPNQRLALDTALGLPRTLDFDVSPDGRRAVLAVAISNRSNLFLAAAGARPGALTSGRWDSAPRFLADGTAVVFVSGPPPSGTDPEAGRLFRLSLGGDPEPLSGPELLVRSPAVAPDGERIAFLGKRRREAASREEPGTGYDLWTLPAAGGEARRLTRHPGDEGAPVWSPDGERIAYRFAAPAGAGLSFVAVVAAVGGGGAGDLLPEPQVLTPKPAPAASGLPDWTPDGAGLAWAARCIEECSNGGYDAIHFADSAGLSPPYALVAAERDLGEPRFRPAADLDGERELAWIESDRGSRRIHHARLHRGPDGRWSPSGRVRIVTRGAGVAQSLRWKDDGSALAALHEAAAFPRDVWFFPLAGGRRRVSDTLFPAIDVRAFARPERIEAGGGKGPTVDAFLYRPPAGELAEAVAGSSAGAPLLVHLRGMPGDAWQDGFDPIVQLFAARGYAVLIPNVRGVGGRGAAFAALNDGDWGGGDLEDLAAATRAAQARPGISAEEACVFGIGYGGFLTLAALARHPALFDCGVEAMGMADLQRLHRALDTGRRAHLETELGPLRGNLETYRRLSLTGEAVSIRSPLLSFHGEEVPEAPLEAKQDFLAALRARADYPLVELYFRGDSGRSVFRWETDRGAAYAFFEKILEFLSVHLPVPALR